MIARQTAVAAAADLKWLTNSAALLRRRLRHTPDEARWWGLVRLLVTEVGMTLKAAAEAATFALRALVLENTHQRQSSQRNSEITSRRDPTGAAALTVDLARYQSVFLANLSRALILETPRRRGRVRQSSPRAVDAARDYGIDVGLILSALERTPAERLQLLDANASFLRAAMDKSK